MKQIAVRIGGFVVNAGNPYRGKKLLREGISMEIVSTELLRYGGMKPVIAGKHGEISPGQRNENANTRIA